MTGKKEMNHLSGSSVPIGKKPKHEGHYVHKGGKPANLAGVFLRDLCV